MPELGASGITVSPIALGSWRTFERMKRIDAERVLGYAIEHGITFLDDARYDDETGHAPLATGYSEVLFGQLFRAVGASLESVTVANKLWWEFWPKQTAVQELQASLERMGFERLPLLYSMNLPDELSVRCGRGAAGRCPGHRADRRLGRGQLERRAAGRRRTRGRRARATPAVRGAAAL